MDSAPFGGQMFGLLLHKNCSSDCYCFKDDFDAFTSSVARRRARRPILRLRIGRAKLNRNTGILPVRARRTHVNAQTSATIKGRAKLLLSRNTQSAGGSFALPVLGEFQPALQQAAVALERAGRPVLRLRNRLSGSFAYHKNVTVHSLLRWHRSDESVVPEASHTSLRAGRRGRSRRR